MSFRIKLEDDGRVTTPKILDLYTLYVKTSSVRTLAVLQAILSEGGTLEAIAMYKGHERFVVTTCQNWLAPYGVRMQRVLSGIGIGPRTDFIHSDKEVLTIEILGPHLPVLKHLLNKGVRVVRFIKRTKSPQRSKYKIEIERHNRMWDGHPKIVVCREAVQTTPNFHAVAQVAALKR
jgi:hypothetical protein